MMAKINLESVSVEFPVYSINSRSIKNQFIRLGTGAKVLADANKQFVVRGLDNINLTIEHGECVGLIGHNGAGKSTFLRTLANIYEPTNGRVTIEGSVSAMLDISNGIESECTGYENIMIHGILNGLTRKQIAAKVEEIADFTGLGDYLYMPVRTYSSGMRVRLGFAVATSINSEILLLDEIFGAGDSEFMKKSRSKMVSLLEQASIVVLATHSDELIKEFCNKALLLESGRVKCFGPVDEVLAVYNQKAKITAKEFNTV
jgi:ABC-2 type transport system ATP-binding protein